MQATTHDSREDNVKKVLENFTRWLNTYGELSRDHQTFFASPTGRAAKRLYYRHKLLGTAAVAPMIFFEAFVPSARRLFHEPLRFPIADAHYAMGFASLYETTGDPQHLSRAQHFLEELKKSRSPDFEEYCWGYPYDWVTRNGTIKQNTPLITSTPYMFEAFLQVAELLESEARPRSPAAPLSRTPRLGGQKSGRICFTNTSKSLPRSRAMPFRTLKIFRHQKPPAAVPTPL